MRKKLLVSAYSREDELAADAFAMDLVRTAGGDALASERLLEKFAQRNAGQGVSITGEYFATQPPFSDRVAHLRAKRPR